MATSYTRNLRLRLTDNLDSNSKYNLERLDLIGSTMQVDTTNTTYIRSRASLIIEPNAEQLGGTGSGGDVSFGTASNPLASLSIHAAALSFSTPPGLLDTAIGGTRNLRIRYKSTLSGAVDTAADRNLDIDMQGGDRELVLGGNIRTAGGNLVLTLTGNTNLTLPTSGTLATLDDIVAGIGDVSGYATSWVTADGLTKSVTHNLQSGDVDVTLIDLEDDTVIMAGIIEVIDNNNIQLTSSELPGLSGWRIVVQAK